MIQQDIVHIHCGHFTQTKGIYCISFYGSHYALSVLLWYTKAWEPTSVQICVFNSCRDRLLLITQQPQREKGPIWSIIWSFAVLAFQHCDVPFLSSFGLKKTNKNNFRGWIFCTCVIEKSAGVSSLCKPSYLSSIQSDRFYGNEWNDCDMGDWCQSFSQWAHNGHILIEIIVN